MHPRVSGAVLLDQVRVLEDLTSPVVLKRAVETMDSAAQAALAALTPVGWCRLETAEGLFDLVARSVGRTTLDLHAEAARVGLERTMKGMWRVLLRLTTDDALIRRTPLLYSKTFDRGDMSARIVEKAHAEIRVVGWPTITPMQLQGIGIGILTVLDVAGRKDVRVTREKTATGALYRATWRK